MIGVGFRRNCNPANLFYHSMLYTHSVCLISVIDEQLHPDVFEPDRSNEALDSAGKAEPLSSDCPGTTDNSDTG